MSDDLPAQFKRLARDLIDTFSREMNVNLAYDEQSLEYLDGYIARMRERMGGQYSGTVNFIGSFLGECIIANFGGQWKQSDKGAWGVYFENNTAAFPFTKVQKAFAKGGEADSIAGFYRVSKMFKEGKVGGSRS